MCHSLDLAQTVMSTSIKEEWIGLIAVAGSFVVMIVGIMAWMVRSVCRTKAQEASRREIAAYVAEGSMSPADGERLMDAGMPKWERPSRPS